MDESSPYQRLEKIRRDTMSERQHQNIVFATQEEEKFSAIRKEKDDNLAELTTKAKSRETELATKQKKKSELLDTEQKRELEEIHAKHKADTEKLEKDAVQAMSRLKDENKADEELLLRVYEIQKTEAEAHIKALKTQLQNERAVEDQQWRDDLCKVADEQSQLTIEVAIPDIPSPPLFPAQPVQRRLDFHSTRSVSAAATAPEFESPNRGIEQSDDSNSGQQPQLQARPRVSSVAPTKRPMADFSSENQNRTPPSLRRMVSDKIRPAADGDIFNPIDPPASSGLFPSPATLLSDTPNPPSLNLARAFSISSTSSQSTVQSVQQAAQHLTSQVNRRQTIGINDMSAGSEGDGFLQPQSCAQSRATIIATPPKNMLRSPFKPGSQPRTFSPASPESSARTRAQLNSSPLSASRGAAVCSNFEIVSVRYNYAEGGGFYNWTRDSSEPTRYFRLSQNTYRPVLNKGKKTGSIEWNIDPSRVWWLKYDIENSLVYLNRKKANSKMGNAGGYMWIVFKNGDALNGFLKSFREGWPHTRFEAVGVDDDIPMTLMRKNR